MIIHKRIFRPLLISSLAFTALQPLAAQQPVNNSYENNLLQHGIEQFNAGLYIQATNSLNGFLNSNFLPTQHDESLESNFDYRQAYYYYVLSNVKGNLFGSEELARKYIDKCSDPVYYQRVSFALAQLYFHRNDYINAAAYYEKAGMDNLTNAEISDAKFELAYCYFYNNRLTESKNLFAAIKDIHNHKYYVPGNYYYGLLAYNDKDYKNALKSFEAIAGEAEYKEVVPYYQAEIHYFLGNKAQLRSLAGNYLAAGNDFHYKKEMHLLRAQVSFEEGKYAEALPDFRYVLNNSDKLRKEVYYEIGYTYYKLKDWNEAITAFKELSVSQDSLGQTAMYLLGDCYLRVNDKKGARNAFGLASDMSYNLSIREAATFLYAKLSYEQGNEIVASRKFDEYIKAYPDGRHANEAKSLLSGLLLKSSNYEEAFNIISSSNLQDNFMKSIYQKVAVGRGLQLLIDKDYEGAYQMLNNSLKYPVNGEYEAIAKFWKAELDYSRGDYKNAVDNARDFLNLYNAYSHAIPKLSAKASKQNAQMIMGYAQMELGDYSNAQTAFSAAQKADAGQDATASVLAVLRSADAAFMRKDYTAADQLYDQAIKKNTTEKDYAIFQRALIAGLNDNDPEKQKLLQSLNNNNTGSTYREAAQVELASMQLQRNAFSEAVASLKSILSTTRNPQVKASATYKLAFAYQSMDQRELAKATYKEYIEKYPSSADRASAMEALRILYTQDSDFDAYIQYARQQDLPEPDELTKQQAYFDIIETAFENRQWNVVVDKASQFTRDYSSSQYATPALYYRGEARRMLQQADKALEDYNEVLKGDWNAYAEDASQKAGMLSLQAKQYEATKNYYDYLLQHTQNAALQKEAYIGLMTAHYELGNRTTAEEYANTLLKTEGVDKSDIGLANLIKARNAIQNKDWNEALTHLNKVSTQNLGILTAESRYWSAYILKEQGKPDDAVKAAEKAVKTSNQYQYWVAKNFMLIATIMLEQKDYFEANAIVEELKKGVKDASLTAEINDLYDRVKAAQLQHSKVE